MMKLITWEFQNAMVHIEFDTSLVSEYWQKQTNLEIEGLFDEYCPADELSGNRIYWGHNEEIYNENDEDYRIDYHNETDLIPSQATVTVVMK